ncbi:hypothetical protein AAMO2058_000631600 [Amorphochlora amoebiformis]
MDSIPHAFTYTDSKGNLHTRDVELMEVRDPLSPGVICQDGSVILVSYRRVERDHHGRLRVTASAVLRYNEMEHEMIPPLDPGDFDYDGGDRLCHLSRTCMYARNGIDGDGAVGEAFYSLLCLPIALVFWLLVCTCGEGDPTIHHWLRDRVDLINSLRGNDGMLDLIRDCRLQGLSAVRVMQALRCVMVKLGHRHVISVGGGVPMRGPGGNYYLSSKLSGFALGDDRDPLPAYTRLFAPFPRSKGLIQLPICVVIMLMFLLCIFGPLFIGILCGLRNSSHCSVVLSVAVSTGLLSTSAYRVLVWYISMDAVWSASRLASELLLIVLNALLCGWVYAMILISSPKLPSRMLELTVDVPR